jgi:sulfoxide reductase heme-binding subunit YedZ
MKIRFNRLQWLIHIGSLIPFLFLIIDGLTNNLTVNPIQEITQRTGHTALLWLIFSLSCTPLTIVFGIKAFNKVRRPLGLYAAFYATLHFLTFVMLDYWFDFQLIFRAVIEKPFIILGSIAFLILLTLTVTSTSRSMKTLGQTWKKLHRLVYAAGILLLIHYLLALKTVSLQWIVYAVLLAMLLLSRVSLLRAWFGKRQPAWGKTVNKFLMGGKATNKPVVLINTSKESRLP